MNLESLDGFPLSRFRAFVSLVSAQRESDPDLFLAKWGDYQDILYQLRLESDWSPPGWWDFRSNVPSDTNELYYLSALCWKHSWRPGCLSAEWRTVICRYRYGHWIDEFSDRRLFSTDVNTFLGGFARLLYKRVGDESRYWKKEFREGISGRCYSCSVQSQELVNWSDSVLSEIKEMK